MNAGPTWCLTVVADLASKLLSDLLLIPRTRYLPFIVGSGLMGARARMEMCASYRKRMRDPAQEW